MLSFYLSLFSAMVFLFEVESFSLSRTLFPRTVFFIKFSLKCFLCVWLILQPNPIALLMVLSFLLIETEFYKGPLNGGSDSMLLMIGLGLFLALVLGDRAQFYYFNPGWAWICFWMALSYLKGGWYKLLQRDWREGKVLIRFLQSSVYSFERFSDRQKTIMKRAAPALCGSLIILELVFAVSLPLRLMAILPFIIGFHLLNAYLFGLSRFFWVWSLGALICIKGM